MTAESNNIFIAGVTVHLNRTEARLIMERLDGSRSKHPREIGEQLRQNLALALTPKKEAK